MNYSKNTLPCILLALGLSQLPLGLQAQQRRPSYEPLSAQAQNFNMLAQAKPSASGHWSNKTPQLALNGNLDPDDHWACEQMPATLSLELPQAQEMNCIKIWPYWGDGRVYQYVIEGSEDGQNWKMLADQSANSITSSKEGQSFEFKAQKVRFLRVVFSNNSKNSGAHVVEIQAFGPTQQQGLQVYSGNINRRYPQSGGLEQLASAKQGVSLQGWRGEKVSAMLQVTSPETLEQLRFGSCELQGPGKHRIKLEGNFLRVTLGKNKPYADILDTATVLPLNAGSNRGIWLAAQIPQDCAEGLYQGVFNIYHEKGSYQVPVKLQVANLRIPTPEKFNFHLDIWQHPHSVARYHDVKLWSEEHFALLKPQMQRLAASGQKTITCSIIHEPWRGQTYDIYPSMIEWTKQPDGTITYDYTVFDRWVQFADSCGLDKARIHCYSMVPWNNTISVLNSKTASYEKIELAPGSPEYEKIWADFLGKFVKHLKAKGWLERTSICLDERPDNLTLAALKVIEKHAPQLDKVHAAVNSRCRITEKLYDISTAYEHSGDFSKERIRERRAKGQKTTVYVCCNPVRPNTFTLSDPAEAEWLGLFCSANDFDGLLRWAYHSWVEDPLKSTDFTSWETGDCFMIYPGNRSSVRWERMHDGIENFEKIAILRALAKQPQARPEFVQSLQQLEEHLAQFSAKNGFQPNVHQQHTERANELIQQATRLAPAVK